MKKVAIFMTNRAERGLLLPVHKRLEEHERISCYFFDLSETFGATDPQKLGVLYMYVYDMIKECDPDLVLASFDRVEMLIVAIAAHTQNIPICQLHAGDISTEGLWDDSVRWAITLLADLVFCDGVDSWKRAGGTLVMAGSSVTPIEIGSTALDDVEIDASLCPSGSIPVGFIAPFDLVLYSPPTKKPEAMNEELESIYNDYLKEVNRPVVWIGPNGDPGSDKIIAFAKMIVKGRTDNKYYDWVPREQFLGLMQNCTLFIGNSSALFLEGPAFLEPEQLIHIGVRNRGRQYVKPRLGGSDRIVKHIADFLGVSSDE